MSSGWGVTLNLSWDRTLDLDVEERDWLLTQIDKLAQQFKSAASPTSMR